MTRGHQPKDTGAPRPSPPTTGSGVKPAPHQSTTGGTMTEEQRQAAQKVWAARNDLNTAVKEARKLGVEVRMTVENHIKWLDSPAGGRVHVKAAIPIDLP